MKKSHPYIQEVQKLFEKASNPEAADAMAAYMRNLFKFYGIKTPERKKLTRQLLDSSPPPELDLVKIAKSAWKQPEREMQYFAIEMLAVYHKTWTIEFIDLFEEMILEKSRWDSVDSIASNLTSRYFKKFPEQIVPVTGKWNQSSNMWLQRSSLLFQLLYKQQMDTDLLKKYILHLRDSNEFFIQKAIGWILRQYGKTNPLWVKKFVRENELPVLSRKEALKNLS